MNRILTIMMYLLWTFTLLGILIITFTNFQYIDLNVIVAVLLFFTLINSFFSLNKPK